MNKRLVTALFSLILLFSWRANASEPVPPIDSQKLFTSPYMTIGDFSPNGDYLTIFTQETDKRSLQLLDVETAQLYILSNFGTQSTISQLKWLNNHRLFVRLSVMGQSYIIDFDPEKPNARASVQPVLMSGYAVDFVAKDSSQLLFAKPKPHANSGLELLLLEPDDLLSTDYANKKRVGIPQGRNTHFFYDDISQRIFSARSEPGEDKVEFLYRTLTNPRWKKFLTIDNFDVEFKPIGFKDDNTLFVLTNQETDKVSLQEFDINTQTLGEVLYAHPTYDLVDADMLELGQVSAVTYIEKGKYKKDYIGSNKDRLTQRIDNTFPDEQWYFVTSHQECSLRVIATYGSDNPGTYYLYNGNTDKAELLSDAFPDLKDKAFSKTVFFTVQTDDGKTVEAYLNKPTQDSHNTLLVMPHGGPIGVRETDAFDRQVQYLNNRGYATLRVNFRGSKGFGKQFMQSAVGEFGKLIEQDIVAALNRVNQEHDFDHVCAMGASYGGYSSTMLAIDFPDKIDCVVATYGIYDLPLLFNESNLKTQQRHIEMVEKVVGKNTQELVDRSPVYLSDKLTQPILLIAGRDDNIATIEHSLRLKYLLEKQGKSIETLFYRDTGHGHSVWKWDRHELATIDDFLRRTLELPNLWENRGDAVTNEILAQEANLLADSYQFKDIVDNDIATAIRHYETAAAYDNPRANYNLGAFYFDGESVAQDFDKAKRYLLRAAELDYPRAYFLLAELYEEGKGLEPDHQQAFDYLTTAVAKGSDADANVKLAQKYCFGKGVEQDIDQCLALLAFKTYAKHEEYKQNEINARARRARKNVLATIITSDLMTPTFSERLHQLLDSEFAVKHHDIEIAVEDFGIIEDGSVIETTAVIPTAANTKLGIVFDIESTGLFTDKKMRNGLVIEWQKQSGDHQEILSAELLNGYPKNWLASITLDDSLSVSDTLTLNIYASSGKLLFAKAFSLKASA